MIKKINILILFTSVIERHNYILHKVSVVLISLDIRLVSEHVFAAVTPDSY